jgi:hypothetical protein
MKQRPPSPVRPLHLVNVALDAWRSELQRGERKPTTFDPLWRAACAEQDAVEMEGMGLPGLGRAFRDEARRIIAAAAEAQRRERQQGPERTP